MMPFRYFNITIIQEGKMFEKKHEMIRKLARDFAEREIAPYAKEIDQTGVYPEWLREKIIKQKFHCITIPEKYGGCGGDYRSAAIVTEEIARKCASSVTQIMPNSLSGAPLI